ncbi:hypothetical protein E1180_12110 [Roseibium denhamense]|nr:hypothetical protein [Roseibium denhamense]MTI06258.1 hypothetical protein [Roseibium denhamense]
MAFCLISGAALFHASSASAQPIDCAAYATAYANQHIDPDPTDLPMVDNAMRGAVAGGAWAGESGARRGAIAGGALSVLDDLGSYPAGWRGLYDMAYRLCRQEQSPVTHRPSTLGDPSHMPGRAFDRHTAPAMPPLQLAPPRPNQ